MNMENASFGYDANNLRQAINNLNLKCVQESVSAINMGMINLRTAVDDSWKGASAEKFKTKIEQDANAVTKAIQEVGDLCSSALESYVSSMADVDNSIEF